MGTQERSKPWPKIALALGSISLVVVGLVFVLVAQDGFSLGGGSSPTPVPHAPWEVRIFTAGSSGAPSAAQRRSTAAEAPAIAAAIEQIYDALILGDEVEALSGGSLTPDAARALSSSRLGLPARMTDAIAVRRHAEIGVDAHRARRAAVRVAYVVEGMRGEREVRVVHHSDMWLERDADGWHAVAYEATRRGR